MARRWGNWCHWSFPGKSVTAAAKGRAFWQLESSFSCHSNGTGWVFTVRVNKLVCLQQYLGKHTFDTNKLDKTVFVCFVQEVTVLYLSRLSLMFSWYIYSLGDIFLGVKAKSWREDRHSPAETESDEVRTANQHWLLSSNRCLLSGCGVTVWLKSTHGYWKHT